MIYYQYIVRYRSKIFHFKIPLTTIWKISYAFLEESVEWREKGSLDYLIEIDDKKCKSYWYFSPKV